jgi:hypothetical protein
LIQNDILKWPQDFTVGAISPPTLTLPLERGGRGEGDAFEDFDATFRFIVSGVTRILSISGLCVTLVAARILKKFNQ